METTGQGFRPKDIDIILARKLEKRIVGKRTVGGSTARIAARATGPAVQAWPSSWNGSQPTPSSTPMICRATRATASMRGPRTTLPGFACLRWALGTKPRLAMELMLWTGARRGDAHRLPPPKNGRIAGKAGKTGKAFNFPLAPMLRGNRGHARGRADNAAGDGLRQAVHRCRVRELVQGQVRSRRLPKCTAHGLSKALAASCGTRRIAAGIKALGQWSGDREVATYVAGANQTRLADSAIDAVLAWEREANIV
jgi:hypothetical protein